MVFKFTYFFLFFYFTADILSVVNIVIQRRKIGKQSAHEFIARLAY